MGDNSAIIRHSASKGAGSADVTGFYEPDTGSVQYVVVDPATKRAAIIDPVLNFNAAHARTETKAADAILRHVEAEGLKVEVILDTHPHADHFTAGAYLKERLGIPHWIGEKVRDVATLWRDIYNEPDSFDIDAAYDRLLAEGETFNIGELETTVWLSPGHTLASISYVVGSDAAFVHDTLMYPDSGSSRADFPGGDARVLYRSLRRILALPEATRLFVGHDYCKDGREPMWEATVAEHRAKNIHVPDGTEEDDFVRVREARDAGLPLPGRMLYALQVNLRGGRLPPAESDGRSYYRIPANRF